VFSELPADAFPLTIMSFDGDGNCVWQERNIQPYTAVEVPGAGPGSVRYLVVMPNEGDPMLFDDPTFGGTV